MSVHSVEFVKGPLVSEFTRDAAEKALRRHPRIASGAAYAVDEVEGRYVAAIVVEADSPFGGPADESEEVPGPKSEGPGDTAPAGPPEPKDADGDSDGDELGGPEGLPGEGAEGAESEGEDGKPKGGEKAEIAQLLQLVQAIGDALGIAPPGGPLGDPGADAGPLGPGGPDGAMPPPPPSPGLGGPPGAGGPPHGGPQGEQRIVHEKALKPGEVPPGGTPIGAPSFSHVRDDHPWKRTAGVVASFSTENSIGDRPLSDVHGELVSLANELGGGYKVAKLEEGLDTQGNRTARAVISVH